MNKILNILNILVLVFLPINFSKAETSKNFDYWLKDFKKKLLTQEFQNKQLIYL